MRFTSPAMTSALRAAASTQARLTTKSLGARAYTTAQEPAKRGGNKLLLATLLGAGVAGGFYYNSAESKVVANSTKVEEAAKTKDVVFNSEAFVQLKLAEVNPISHDTSIFRFELPKDHITGLPVASCIVVKHTPEEGKPIIRPYTPVSPAETEGHVDFIIKKYNTGKMTPVIHDMKVGDTLEFKGPIMKYDWEKDQKANVGMIAGGTGITPMLQLIRRIFNEKSTDKQTKVSLIFANQTENDILLKEELDKIAKEHPDRFKVVYAVDKASDNWTGLTGYVTKEAVDKHLPGPQQEDSVIFVCGPPPMVNSIAGPKDKMKQGELKGILAELGYKQENVFKF